MTFQNFFLTNIHDQLGRPKALQQSVFHTQPLFGDYTFYSLKYVHTNVSCATRKKRSGFLASQQKTIETRTAECLFVLLMASLGSSKQNGRTRSDHVFCVVKMRVRLSCLMREMLCCRLCGRGALRKATEKEWRSGGFQILNNSAPFESCFANLIFNCDDDESQQLIIGNSRILLF